MAPAWSLYLGHVTTDHGVDLIRTRLHERYGMPVKPQRLAPLDELVVHIFVAGRSTKVAEVYLSRERMSEDLCRARPRDVDLVLGP